ncbi:hypothetical protein G9A89_007321 [Geosiphon pyriformis]|nr:hypothetical protein G9A89_007321 [Geosiphon pyriformis]
MSSHAKYYSLIGLLFSLYLFLFMNNTAHSNSLPEAVMLVRALESAEKEANHSQIVNMIIEKNKTEMLEKRVIQLGEKLSKKIKNATRNSVIAKIITCHARTLEQKHAPAIFANKSIHANITSIPYHIPKSRNLLATAHNSQLKLASRAPKSAYVESKCPTYLNISENLNLENINGNVPKTKNITNNQNLIQTIPPAIVMKDSSLAAIFSFELKEKETMFNGAALNEEHPITAMYTEAKVNNMSIKFILDSRSTRSIVTFQLVNQLGFKVDCTTISQIIIANGSTKLSHELLINYNGHHAKIPAICGHFQKPSTNQRPIFEFEKNPVLPAIKTYQLS